MKTILIRGGMHCLLMACFLFKVTTAWSSAVFDMKEGDESRVQAVLIGQNYKRCDTSNLEGCINDALSIKEKLQKFIGLDESAINLLTDEKKALKVADVKTAIAEVAEKTQGDNPECKWVYISFSGHGTQKRDYSRKEGDGKDEVLVIGKETLVDDTLHQWLSWFGENSVVFLTIDACHSGTAADLAYTYLLSTAENEGELEEVYSLDDDSDGMKISLRKERSESKYKIKAKVIMISGCRDDETSMDAELPASHKNAQQPVIAQGVFTHALLNTVFYDYGDSGKYTTQPSLFSLLGKINSHLNKDGFSQSSTLSSSFNLSSDVKMWSDYIWSPRPSDEPCATSSPQSGRKATDTDIDTVPRSMAIWGAAIPKSSAENVDLMAKSMTEDVLRDAFAKPSDSMQPLPMESEEEDESEESEEDGSDRMEELSTPKSKGLSGS